MALVGAATLTPSPHIPTLPGRKPRGLGHNWSRCLLLWVAAGGIHWTNQGSHVCRPIRSDER